MDYTTRELTPDAMRQFLREHCPDMPDSARAELIAGRSIVQLDDGSRYSVRGTRPQPIAEQPAPSRPVSSSPAPTPAPTPTRRVSASAELSRRAQQAADDTSDILNELTSDKPGGASAALSRRAQQSAQRGTQERTDDPPQLPGESYSAYISRLCQRGI